MRIRAKHEVCGFSFNRAAWNAFSNFQTLAVPTVAGPWTSSTSKHLYHGMKFVAHPDIRQRIDVTGRMLCVKREANRAAIEAVPSRDR